MVTTLNRQEACDLADAHKQYTAVLINQTQAENYYTTTKILNNLYDMSKSKDRHDPVWNLFKKKKM